MARRQRDYAAEYRARQARSQARYGVSYNQQRRILAKAERTQVPASEVRAQLARFASQGLNAGHIVDSLISQVIARNADWKAGREVQPISLDFGDDGNIVAPRNGTVTLIADIADYVIAGDIVATVARSGVYAPPDWDSFVTSVYVNTGDRVAKGQKIMELLPAEYIDDMRDGLGDDFGDEWNRYH